MSSSHPSGAALTITGLNLPLLPLLIFGLCAVLLTLLAVRLLQLEIARLYAQERIGMTQRKPRMMVRLFLDALAPSMMLIYMLGRVFFQMFDYFDSGIAKKNISKPDWFPTWMWMQAYEKNIFGEIVSLYAMYLAPICELAIGLVCFALLWRLRKHPYLTGWLFAVCLLLAGLGASLINRLLFWSSSFAGPHGSLEELITGLLVILGLLGVALLGRRQAVATFYQKPEVT